MTDLVFSLRGVGKTRPGGDGFCLHIDRLDVPRGSLLALVGPSGCGKSTALDMLACALSPDMSPAGFVLPHPVTNGKTVSGDDAALRFVFRPAAQESIDVLAAWRSGGTDALARLRLKYLGYVLQTGGLLPFLSAQENIVLRCKSLGTLTQRREATNAVEERLGIGHLLRQYPATLSVGERQRVAIASALAHGPSVVLADEPTAALDPCHAADVLRLFAELARNMGITVVMVTHNLDQARQAGFTLAEVQVAQGPHGIGASINWMQGQA
jgi:putative ABC transport system ATP-binding protein